MQDKASCAQHDKHRNSCSDCVRAEVDRVAARDFPEELLAPWRGKVADAGLAGWSARMLPFNSEWHEQVFALARYEQKGGVGIRLNLTGTDQDELVAVAESLA